MGEVDGAATGQSHVRTHASDLSEAIRRGKYMLFDRLGPAFVFNATATTPAAASAAQGQTDGLMLNGGLGNNYLEMFQTTAQTLFPTYVAGKGLDIGCDKVDNEAVEYVPGGNRSDNPLGYLAGTDPGVFIRVTMEIADTSGIDQLCIGFRKQEAYAVPVSFLTTGDALYTDFAGLGFSGTAAANLIKSMTDIGNLGSTTVTSTLFAAADATINTFEVRIKGRRVQYLINGARAGDRISKNGIGAAITAQNTTQPPIYNVTSGLFMIPFIFQRYDATSPGTSIIRRIEAGQLAEVGLDPDNRDPQSTTSGGG